MYNMFTNSLIFYNHWLSHKANTEISNILVLCDEILFTQLTFDVLEIYLIKIPGNYNVHIYKLSSVLAITPSISKTHMFLLMDAKIQMISLIIMFAVHPICIQDSIFKISSTSHDLVLYNHWLSHKTQNQLKIPHVLVLSDGPVRTMINSIMVTWIT